MYGLRPIPWTGLAIAAATAIVLLIADVDPVLTALIALTWAGTLWLGRTVPSRESSDHPRTGFDAERMGELIEAAGTPLLLTQGDRITIANPAARRVLGDHVIGQGRARRLAPPRRARLDRGWRRHGIRARARPPEGHLAHEPQTDERRGSRSSSCSTAPPREDVGRAPYGFRRQCQPRTAHAAGLDHRVRRDAARRRAFGRRAARTRDCAPVPHDHPARGAPAAGDRPRSDVAVADRGGQARAARAPGRAVAAGAQSRVRRRGGGPVGAPRFRPR